MDLHMEISLLQHGVGWTLPTILSDIQIFYSEVVMTNDTTWGASE